MKNKNPRKTAYQHWKETDYFPPFDMLKADNDKIEALRQQVEVQDRMIDDLQSEHRRERNRAAALRKRLDAAKTLAEDWRRPSQQTGFSVPGMVRCADELEAALKGDGDE